MERIYHPYWKWECYKNGMWRKESKEYELLKINEIIEFTSNHIIYGESMIKAVNLWKYSCENFLSNPSLNKLAYIGHAGCNIEKKYPEYLVRKAWKELTEKQRILANNEALKAINLWKQKIKSNIILNHGKKKAITKEYQMKLHMN